MDTESRIMVTLNSEDTFSLYVNQSVQPSQMWFNSLAFSNGFLICIFTRTAWSLTVCLAPHYQQLPLEGTNFTQYCGVSIRGGKSLEFYPHQNPTSRKPRYAESFSSTSESMRMKPNAKNNGYNLIQKPCRIAVLYISVLQTLWTNKTGFHHVRPTAYQSRGVCHHSYWQRERGCWVWVCPDLHGPHTQRHTLCNRAVHFVVKSLWLKNQWNQN